MIILRRIDSLFCWLKRAYASMNMSACTLFNEPNKAPNLLIISTWSVLGKQNVQAKKVYCSDVASAPNATTHGPCMTKWKMMWSSAQNCSRQLDFWISHLIARDQETVNFKAGAFSGANVTVDFHNYFFLITFSFTAKTFVIKLRLIPSAGLTIVNKEVLPYLFVFYCYTIV